MNTEQLLKLIDKNYSSPKIELIFTSPFELLIATILSAQCPDTRVNKVTEKLFKKYKSPEDYLKAGEENLLEDIKTINFYKNKAKNIIGCCKIILEKYNGKVPEKLEELVKLPGIGRKTANVIIGLAFNRPAIIVDTHVRRVAKRLGLTDKNDADKIELELQKIIPEKCWTKFSLALILHGRYICKARKPLCEKCIFQEICEKKI